MIRIKILIIRILGLIGIPARVIMPKQCDKIHQAKLEEAVWSMFFGGLDAEELVRAAHTLAALARASMVTVEAANDAMNQKGGTYT